MPDDTVDSLKFSLAESIKSYQQLHGRAENMLRFAFVCFTVSAMIRLGFITSDTNSDLANVSVPLINLKLPRNVAVSFCWFLGISCMFLRSLELIGMRLLKEKIKRLHSSRFSTDASLWYVTTPSYITITHWFRAFGFGGNLVGFSLYVAFLVPVGASLYAVLESVCVSEPDSMALGLLILSSVPFVMAIVLSGFSRFGNERLVFLLESLDTRRE